ncbi:restriction endonuclease subunit S [Campylobacter vicugnae]|uniref:restriction endonuclease subunit S n=1 Tax=Campylobacter vicugnae TaxID=1660076 RepID=UPI00254D239D|nr:restriction endonuclease subunit S [Campylobacter ovis]MDL0095810.1 restriction endonuclease subunit S [Campylobacter ovis]
MNKIPKGWEKYYLSDCFNAISIKNKIKTKDYLPQGKFPIIDQGQDFISGYSNDENLLIKVKKPIIIFGDHTRCFKFINFDFIAGADGIKILEPKDNFNEKLFYYFCQILDFPNKGYSRHFQYLKKAIINFPKNLSEQKAIVDKLDDSFAKIENAITNLINAKENLKLYKQSVLKSAFNGDLLPNTSPTHWEVKKLGEICEINPKTEILLLNESDEVSFIPMASVEAETNIFTESKSKFSKVKKGYTKFRDNDILFAKITPCMENGKICIVNNLKFGIGFGSTEFHVIRPNKNTLSKYIYYFVSQISFRQMAQIYMTGAVGQRRVPSKILENFEIPLPPLSEQNLIVAEINRRFAIVDKTLNLIDKSIQNAKNLKQSILKKAFSGELRSEI